MAKKSIKNSEKRKAKSTSLNTPKTTTSTKAGADLQKNVK